MLQGLWGTLQETVKAIKENLRTFKLGKGLASIPDEVLSEILEHVVKFNYGLISIYDRGNLSLVCRRFRRVVLETPRMWTDINSSHKKPYILACLTKSKSAGLCIDLSFNANRFSYSLDQSLSIFSTILHHSSRWEQLHVYVSTEQAKSENLEKLRQSKLFSSIHLPSLHTLTLGGPLFRGFSPAQEEFNAFYQSWEMPNLRSLRINHGVPKSIVAPNLISVELDLVSFDDGTGTSQQLQDFVSAVPTVEELYISLYRGDRQGFHRDFVLDMPKLKALNLSALCAGRSDIRSLMVALRAPALRKMKIVMSTPNSEDDRDTALNDFFPQDDYPFLEDLTLKMSTTGSLAFATFHLPFTKLRALRSLWLDTPGLYPYICKSNTQGREDGHPPPLRTIKIVNYCNTEHRWIDHLREILKEQGIPLKVTDSEDEGLVA